MQPIQLIVEHRLDQQGNPIAEVSGLPRLGALLYPDQMQQLGRQLIQAAIVAQQGERGTRLYPAEDRTMTEQQACTLCGAGWHTAANCIWNGSEKGLALAQRIDKNLDERAQFESWVRREWPGAPLHHVRDALPVNDPRYGEYCNENIQRGWVGWQARAALAQPSPAPELERGSIHVEARECIGCGHSGINDAADGFATCSACAWIGKEPVKDECPKCQRENVMAAACPMCHCRYILIADGHIKAPVGQAGQVPDGVLDLCRFLAKLYCELDGLRYSTAKLPPEEIADALICKWPVLQGTLNQLNIKRISEQPYDESNLQTGVAALLAAAPAQGGE